MTYFQRKRMLPRSDFVIWFFEVNRTVAFDLVSPVIVALFGGAAMAFMPTPASLSRMRTPSYAG